MRSEPVYVHARRLRVTRRGITRNGEVVFDGVLHRDTHEPLVDGKDGESTPPHDVSVAPG